jgi:putative flippase GtrA
MAIYFVLTRFTGIYYIYASILAFIVAVTWSFYINKKWTFRNNSANHKEQYIKFFISNIIAFVINISLLSLFVEIFNINDLIAQLMSSLICAFINFTFNRFWTFNDLSHKATDSQD